MPSTADMQRVGDRLRRARLMRGLSLRDLSDRLASQGIPLSHAAVQKYEKGQMGPDSRTLLALSRTLQLDPGYFFRSQSVNLETIEFRKLSKFPKKEVNRVREEAADFFEKYLQIESILEIEAEALPRFPVAPLITNELTDQLDSAEKAAKQLRKKWKLGDAPLTNVHELLEEHGIKIKEVETDESFNGFSGWADEKTPVIVLAKWLNADLPRKRLTALHELGHLVLEFPDGLTHKQIEDLCFRFAAAMLLPAEQLINRLGKKRKDLISFPERLGIKEDWGISVAALMRRTKELGIITPSQWKSFTFLNSKYRKKEPNVWPGTENANRFEQLVFRAASQELITRAKAAELLGVTLREFDQRFDAPAA